MYKQNSLKARLRRLEAYQGNSIYETALLVSLKDGRYTFNMDDPTDRINKTRITNQDLENAINRDDTKIEKLLDKAHIKALIIDDITEL